MKKKLALLLLIPIVFIGSFVVFYSGNLLSSDLSNMFYGVHDVYFVSSLPLFFVTCNIICALLYVVRVTIRPQYKRSLSIRYSIMGIINSVIAIVFAFISGLFVYHSLTNPYPFKGYTILMIILNFVLLGLYIFSLVKFALKLPLDNEKRKIGAGYVLYNIGLSLALYFSMYRLGSFLWMASYVQVRTLYLTWVFYLWVLLPFAFVGHSILYMFKTYKKKTGKIISVILFIINFVLGATVLLLGYNYPEFVSAISPALPLERLSTKPVDTIIDFVVMTVLAGYLLFYSTKEEKNTYN